jgi:ribonuclease BN (tRNA processing enzyme)
MRLTVLGCAGTFPNADSPCSAYLLEHDGFRLLLDLGHGALGGLQRHSGLLEVDAVMVSHLHADHCLDLIPYSYARRFHADGPAPVLPVYGPAGTQHRLVVAFGPARPADGLVEVYDFRTTTAGSTAIGPFEVALTPTAHPVETYAPTVSAGGRRLTYSADTGPSDALARAAAGSDVFVCEATWVADRDYPPDLHMTARDAGAHAARAGVGRLLLTHTTPFTSPDRLREEAGAEYAGPLELARAGTTYDV